MGHHASIAESQYISSKSDSLLENIRLKNSLSAKPAPIASTDSQIMKKIAVKFETSSFPVPITTKRAARQEIGWHEKKVSRWSSIASIATYHRRIINGLAGLL